jgi:hypothetical protein
VARLPETGPSLARHLRQQQRLLRRVGTASPFTRSGASVTSENVTMVDGQWQSTDFDGNLDAGNAGTKGWAMNAVAAAFGALFLRPGSISNDALTNPVKPDAPYGYRQNFGLTTTLSNIYTLNVPVPAGFTQAAVSITASVYAVNPNTTGGSNGTGGDYLYVQANINGYNGFALPLGISGSNGSGTNRSPFSTVLGGLAAGGSISLQVAASTGFTAFAANANNTAEITGSISWFR